MCTNARPEPLICGDGRILELARAAQHGDLVMQRQDLAVLGGI
jgi:hypothetical protein